MHPIKDATNQTCYFKRYKRISIHAPYKGCNKNVDALAKDLIISIHAPYKGCNFHDVLPNLKS